MRKILFLQLKCFFHLSMVKTCEFLAESNVLNICTEPFIENVAQKLLLQHLCVRFSELMLLFPASVVSPEVKPGSKWRY